MNKDCDLIWEAYNEGWIPDNVDPLEREQNSDYNDILFDEAGTLLRKYSGKLNSIPDKAIWHYAQQVINKTTTPYNDGDIHYELTCVYDDLIDVLPDALNELLGFDSEPEFR